MQGHKWGSPLSPPLWSQFPSLQWAHIEGTKGTGGNTIGPGEPKKSCHWLTEPFEVLSLVRGTSQELGIGLRSDAIGQGVFCHSLWLWSERKRSGNEAQWLGRERAGQQLLGLQALFRPQQDGQNWCQTPARKGEPKPASKPQRASHVQSPPPWGCPAQCPS